MYTFAQMEQNERQAKQIAAAKSQPDEIEKKFTENCTAGYPLASVLGRKVEFFFMDGSQMEAVVKSLGLQDSARNYLVEIEGIEGISLTPVEWSSIRKFICKIEDRTWTYSWKQVDDNKIQRTVETRYLPKTSKTSFNGA